MRIPVEADFEIAHQHRWGFAYFCVDCGRGLRDVVDQQLVCDAPSNVIAISHFLAERRAKDL